jgi:RNA-directed DNA polymerase
VSEPKPKSFEISKWAVWEAYRRVKDNRGGAGVDEQSMAEFEEDLQGNLYRLWNRLSSGSYFPPPVRAVEIPKRDGSLRTLGVPTVADRIAQTVARLYLEPSVEPVFHEDSYGYRPGRSAHDAIGVCRERCWRNDWVLDSRLSHFWVDSACVLGRVGRAGRSSTSRDWATQRELVSPSVFCGNVWL